MKPIVFHPEAQDDLDEAVAYHERRYRGRGMDLKAEIQKELERIQQNPQLRSQYKSTDYRKSVLQKYPYNIFYQVTEEFIWVGAVAHHNRKPDYWKDRTID